MIIVQLLGGLGNQMFQYALGRNLALMNNTELKLDPSFLENRVPFKKGFAFRNYDLDLFDIKATCAISDDIPLYNPNWKINSIPHRLYNLYQIRRRGYQYLIEWKLNSYNTILYDKRILKKKGNLYLAGYWASPKYFYEIKDIIRAEFVFKEELSSKCIPFKEKITSSNSVCITIRRTDFLVVKAMGVHGLEYILKAVDHILKKVSNPVFFIFSDDMDWCKTHIKLDQAHYFVDEEFYGEKFKDKFELMRLCKHIINANSNFAFWAAWLSNNNDKVVITPEKYYHDRDSSDLVPNDWIKI